MRKSDRRQKLTVPQIIKDYATRKGVTILFDGDGSSPEAKISSPYSYSSKDKTLLIVVPLIKEEDKPLVFEIIREAFEDGGLIWKSEKERILESYKEYVSSNTDRKTLEFFKNVLDRNDFAALKLSLYLRSELKKGRNVSLHKQEIRDRFGDRGANIANLCTAGYFESEFMSLYNEGSEEEFFEFYELAVGKKARALFVHSMMSEAELEDAFHIMVDKGLKYHMHDFRVHGMGASNVRLIKKFFTSPPASDRYFIQKRQESKYSIEYEVTFL